MQWLIDIIQEWVTANFLQTAFVWRGNRGLPSDFSLVDFTRDGAYHALDFSAIVPAGAKAVVTNWRVKTNNIGDNIKWRQTGGTDTLWTCFLRPQIAGVDIGANATLPINAARQGSYAIPAGGWQGINMQVMGWIL